MSYGDMQAGAGAAYGGRGSGPRAGFWRRFAAALLDGILLGVVYVGLAAALKTPGAVLGLIAGITYFVLLEGGPRGQTMGKSALGIRVISFSTGGALGYPKALVRYVGRIASSILLYLGYLWMLWDREHQTWHDKIAGTVVVPVSAYPLPPR